MLLKIEIDIEEALEALAAVNAVVTSLKLSEAAGAFAVARILTRTSQGKDVNDNGFAPYSSGYAKRKGSYVDLFNTGAMLGAVEHKTKSETQTDIGIYSSEEAEIASYHEQGTDTMPQRRFIGLSGNDQDDMVETIVNDPIAELMP